MQLSSSVSVPLAPRPAPPQRLYVIEAVRAIKAKLAILATLAIEATQEGKKRGLSYPWVKGASNYLAWHYLEKGDSCDAGVASFSSWIVGAANASFVEESQASQS